MSAANPENMREAIAIVQAFMSGDIEMASDLVIQAAELKPASVMLELGLLASALAGSHPDATTLLTAITSEYGVEA